VAVTATISGQLVELASAAHNTAHNTSATARATAARDGAGALARLKQLAGGTIGGQLVELGWRYSPLEHRNTHGEWSRDGAGAGVLSGGMKWAQDGAAYQSPPADRQATNKTKASDNPFIKKYGLSAAHIVSAYDAATPDERAQGMRWYSDAHDVAASIGQGDAAKGAAMLSAFSPQTDWATDTMNAAATLANGQVPAHGIGITEAVRAKAQAILAAPDETALDKLFPEQGASKTRAFYQLIRNGGDTPGDTSGGVVIDRHALSVAAGRRLANSETAAPTYAELKAAHPDWSPEQARAYKATFPADPTGSPYTYQHIGDMYRAAAKAVSERDGVQVSPHQMQAITWIHQLHQNDADASHLVELGAQAVAAGAKMSSVPGAVLANGFAAMKAKQHAAWAAYAAAHAVPVHAGTTLAGTVSAQLDLAWKDAWRTESRGKHGEWETGAEAAIARLRAAFPPGKQAAADRRIGPARVKARDALIAAAAAAKAKAAAAGKPSRRYVGQKPGPGETFYLPDPDRQGQNVKVMPANEDGHVHVEDAAGRRQVVPAEFTEHPMQPNRFTGGPPPAAGMLQDPPLKQPAFSAVPKASEADKDDPTSKRLDADAATGVSDESSPKARARKAGLNSDAFGNSAQTSIVTFGNGHQWIRKRGLDTDEMHREVLVSRVSGVLGAGAPPVILRPQPAAPGTVRRLGQQEMWEPLVTSAQPAAAWISQRGGMDDNGEAERPEAAVSDMVSSTQGTKIGILDTITSNYDRHPGNWMVQHDDATGQDTPVPIDHGHALMDDGQIARYGGKGPFGEALFADGRESEQLAAIPAAAWQKWIKGVTALRPQAKAYGMNGELNNVIVGLSNAADISDEAKYQLPNATGHPFTPDDVSKWTGATA
jgi:hypothetical protein